MSAIPDIPPDREPRHTTILVVDDEQGIRSYLGRLLTAQGYRVTFAVDGGAALATIAETPPDLVLLDVNIPGPNGVDVCGRLRRNAATRLTPIIVVTGLSEKKVRIEALEAGADDFLNKPIDTEELLARVGSLLRMKQYTDDLDSAASIIMTLSAVIECRDGYSDGHCHRMANYATGLGRALGLSEADHQTLYRGGFLHDIGMLAIPDNVLRKKGRLETEEYELVKSHTVFGDALCRNLRSLQQVRPIVRWHHERLDGSGYPDGLVGDQIPVLAQIVGLVDVYEAITVPRAYQNPMSPDAAMQVLRSHVEHGWRDGELVERFIDLVRSDAAPAG